MQKIVLATSNPGKIIEIRDLLKNLPFNLLSMVDFNIPDAEETGLTFVENAILKARHVCKISGLPALSDDSGLIVQALNGRPGVFSARYAGPNATDTDKINKVIAEFKESGSEDRRIEFHCVLVFMQHPDEPSPLIAHGVWQGEILLEPRGNRGFGYDPLFFAPEYGLSAGEMEQFEKNRIGHRGRAMEKLKQSLEELFPS